MKTKETKKILFALCLLLLSLWLAACRRQDDAWERVQQTGVLRVGLDPTYPPFETFDGETLSGLDVDLARAIAADLGAEVEFVHFGFDGLYDALDTEQVDVLLSALVAAPERAKDFAYSEPYFNAGEVLVVRAEEEEIEGMADLNGRSLSVELGAQGHVLATEWERKLPGLTLVPFNTPDEAITAVLQNQTDAALIDHISARLFLRETAALKIIAEPVSVEPFAIVTRQEDGNLLAQIDRSLARLKASGQLDAILQTWLDS
jgi:polar amino acid transport system substrate-binding protein